MSVFPNETMFQGQRWVWPESVVNLWNEKVAPIFKEGETCSYAIVFAPRPWKNEYDRGSPMMGFTYTLLEHHVVVSEVLRCFKVEDAILGGSALRVASIGLNVCQVMWLGDDASRYDSKAIDDMRKEAAAREVNP